MGCTFSHFRRHRHGESSRLSNVFKVYNVDKEGAYRNPGQIEITDIELVFHHKNKDPVRWPLRYLRRYGFDSEIFSFESGRRCPTGAGIYAFKCRRAESLFNLLQECIQRAGSLDDAMHVPAAGARDMSPAVVPVHIPSDDITRSLPDVVQGAHGIIALQDFPRIADSEHVYLNNTPSMRPRNAPNPALDLTRQVTLPNDNNDPPIQYAQLELEGHDPVEEEPALNNYNNLPAGEPPRFHPVSEPPPLAAPDAQQQDYLNVGGAGDASGLKLSSSVPLIEAPLPPVPEDGVLQSTSHPQPHRSDTTETGLSYIEVDFPATAGGGGETPKSPPSALANSNINPLSGQLPSDAPVVTSQASLGYAIIDFNKTDAIKSLKNNNEFDVGGGTARKTRHDSTNNFG